MTRLIRPADIEAEVREKTIINFLLDETGSMLDRKDDVIKGFNEYIRSMKQERESSRRILFTLTKFNSKKGIQIEYLAKDIDEVPQLTKTTYMPDAGTPLYDAIGETVSRLTRELQDEKKKTGVLFVIMTDGEENDSKEFRDKAKITKVIQDKEKEGWTFVYLGADQNAWSQAGAIGMQVGNVMSFQSDHYAQTFAALSNRTSAYYKDGSHYTRSFFEPPDESKSKSWADGISIPESKSSMPNRSASPPKDSEENTIDKLYKKILKEQKSKLKK
jgi:hypothetical protein